MLLFFYALFPKNDLSEIYLKSWTANGTIQTIVFKPVQNQQTENLPSTQSEMKIGLSDDATEAFMKRFEPSFAFSFSITFIVIVNLSE